MIKSILSFIFIIAVFNGCSEKKEQQINYKIQQQNSKEALKDL